MRTPIIDFAEKYASSSAKRFHMPGHKGSGILGVEATDITEITGADVLYSAKGIIKESEENAAKLFDTEKTFYSTEGSSLCIRAMLYLLSQSAKEKGKKPLILAARNAHKTFISAAAIMDIDVEWFFGGEDLLSCTIDLELLENAIKEYSPTALYITSPDYLGNIADIKKVAELCHRYKVVLAVDNAHGAYLKFLNPSLHPMDLGADICCDSAHKTLPVLTGGAYLHISKNADSIFADMAENALSLFASTSPSYIILQSLDGANKIMSRPGFVGDILKISEMVKALVARLKAAGYNAFLGEPLKLTICARDYGYRGSELAKLLENQNIFPEFADPDFLVLMFSASSTKSEIKALEEVLLSIQRKPKIERILPIFGKASKKISPNKAVNSLCERVSAEKAVGRILATASINCPPAVPILVCGEEITENAIEWFKYYNIKEVFVVKE